MTIKTYQVGGCVRDRLLGVPSKDIDYAVEAPSFEAMLTYVAARCEKVYVTKPEFVTIRARYQGEDVDFVLCRKDGQYGDGRRPDSVEPGTLHEDLARRDFSVNAIAYDEETGEYIDPFNGRAYLEANILACVGSTYDRFSEDALRLLRAVRFHITRGFDLATDITAAFTNRDLADRLRTNVSTERKREELTKCFLYDTHKTMALLVQYPRLSEACFEDGKLRLLPTQKVGGRYRVGSET